MLAGDSVRWTCMIKARKNRYVVCGADHNPKSAHQYTQVFKLFDSQLKVVSTLVFPKHKFQRVAGLVLVGRSAILALTGNAKVHVLQFRSWRLSLIRASVDVGPGGHFEASSVSAVVDNRFAIGLADAQVAVIKVVFR